MAHPVLDLAMRDNDAGAATIRDYLKQLLLALFVEGQGFSGKRPFGNSGWEWDVFIPLVREGLVPGKLDAQGWIEEVDSDAAQKLIDDAIRAL